MAARREWRGRGENIASRPNKRKDGEMYKRPKPNPFSVDWLEGYDDGIAGIDGCLHERDPQNYWDGVAVGAKERTEVALLGDSNA